MKNTSHTNRLDRITRQPAKQIQVMFVGLSAKPETNDLCSSTNTGKIIAAIEDKISERISIYKTNAVKYAPLDKAGKLRYPTNSEMLACLPALSAEITKVAPRIIVPLGGQVSKFLLQHLGQGEPFSGFSSDFSYETYSLPSWQIMPVHHPSYIWIYKRKKIDKYVEQVGSKLTELACLP